MKFDASYFENEVREGFYIPGMTKRSWAIQMDILERIADICNRHGLKWFADYGTLLGAVRHRGFIPWDDDLDICMFRNDYLKLNAILKEELPADYQILNLANEPEYSNFLTRVTNGSGINTGPEHLKDNRGFPYVAGIDIFPLDYLYEDEAVEEDRRLRAKRVWDIATSVLEQRQKGSNAAIIAEAEKLGGISIDRSLPLYGALLRVLEHIFKECTEEASGYVALMPFWIQYKNHKFPMAHFAHTVQLPFETTTINVPAAYEQMLTLEYGLWQKINRKGGIHDYPFYREQERILADHNGGRLSYRYQFSTMDLRNEERKKHALEADWKAKTLHILSDAHVMIRRALEQNNVTSALELLQKCQEMAIRVGTALEGEQGEGLETIKCLEEYCEQTYQLYEQLLSGGYPDVSQEYQKLSEMHGRIRDSYFREVKQRREVMFFPFRHKEWSKMLPLYRKMLAEPDTEVYVVPIPYYEKNADGSLGKEYFDLEQYSFDLPLLDYRKIDFEHRHPNAMVIQNPYDSFDTAISVHPFFYAANLKKYTDQLIYLPYLEPEKVDPEDEKAGANLPLYVITPGVIHADKVVLPSEQIKKDYMDALLTVIGEGTEENWQSRIVVEDFHFDIESECEQNRQTSDNRKCLLFFDSFSDYYAHGETALKKLEQILATFEQAKDSLRVIWILENTFEENIKTLCSQLYPDYRRLKEYFLREGIGECRTLEQVAGAIEESDAYYGSGGYAMNLAVRKGIPVMIKSVN